MRLHYASAVFAIAVILPLPDPSAAQSIDVCGLFSNPGFESGNLSGWTLTQPNTSYVPSLSPPVNPSINPADPADNPATLSAPAGSYFTGLMDPDDNGIDLKYKLAHTVISDTDGWPAGTSFSVKVWANRGRLEPFDTPVSTGVVTVRIFGWNAGSAPTVTPSTDNWSRTITWNPAVQNFTAWAADGSWASQTFTFTPPDPTILRYLSIAVTGQNNNHDQYVAIDLCDAPTGIRQSTWGSLKVIWR
jgi:hypothetical protein